MTDEYDLNPDELPYPEEVELNKLKVTREDFNKLMERQHTLYERLEELERLVAQEPEVRIKIRYTNGNTVTGNLEQVLDIHLLDGWTLDSYELHYPEVPYDQPSQEG